MNVTDQSTIARDRKLLQVVLYTIFAAMPLLVAVVVVLSIWALQGRANDRDQIRAIQEERIGNIRDNCVETNRRHDATIAALDARFVQLAASASAKERQQLQASRDFTVSLIDALAPKDDCAARVRDQTEHSTS
jgi:hypothetical protein